jgi:hypothetical protein
MAAGPASARTLEHPPAREVGAPVLDPTKWLKAGVLENGEWSISEKGTPQGAVASPLLANVYLHYVFDLWAKQWRRREATGNVVVVRYARGRLRARSRCEALLGCDAYEVRAVHARAS